MALPVLPGFSLRRTIGGEKFHRSQICCYSNNVPTLFEDKRRIGGELLPGQTLKLAHSVFPEALGSSAPAWIAFDKQVLTFDAYFEEVPYKNQEQYRIRHCKIYFYLEDGTIQVTEPKVENSGFSQGTIVRRHQIPLLPPQEDQFYTIYDFNINTEVTFYGRKYKIIDCDLYTKKFLRKIGIRVNPPASHLDDPYTTERRKARGGSSSENLIGRKVPLLLLHLASTNPLRPYEHFDTLKQFLDFDGQVLGFTCVWHDPESRLSGPRELVLRYYLGDTIVIREVLPENSGRDIVPYFLKRDKLPKNAPTDPCHPGTITNYTLLNVLGKSERNKGCYIRDLLQTGAVHREFYKDSDLKIGAVINVWGRQMLICDCDEFTKEHYRTKYGIVDFTPIPYKTPPPPKPEKTFPPYNGFGSEEDSLCSCMGVVLKPHHKDYRQFLVKDRYGVDRNILRFGAKLITDSPIDKERKFIISYFLSNDTVSIYEYSERNSGIAGGKFLERGHIKKPGQELFKVQLSEYYKAHDLFVGARVCFHGHNFLLVDADEYTFNYMEKNANENVTESHAKEIRKTFDTTDPEHTNVIGYDAFRKWIVSVADGAFSEHEIMTLGRHYGMRDESQTDLLLLLSVAQGKLKKNAFEYFEQLTAVFMYNDQKKYEDNQKQVDCGKFLHGLNWRENQVCAFKEVKEPPKREDIWNQLPQSPPVTGIKYPPLLDDLFGKEE